MPETTFSGTGLAGIETSVMAGTGWVKGAENQGRARSDGVKKGDAPIS
jgi:hypothetical protein